MIEIWTKGTGGATKPRRSRKTTLAGIIGAVGILLVAAAAIFDGDPATKTDLGAAAQAFGYVLAALGLGAGFGVARDDDVSSEGARATKDEAAK